MKLHRRFFQPLATGAPAPFRELPVRLERMIHFVPPHNDKVRARVPELAGTVDVVLGNLEDAVKADLEKARPGLHDLLRGEAAAMYGPRPGKPAVARFMADRLAAEGLVPNTLRETILRCVDLVGGLKLADREALEIDRLFG